MLLLYSELKNGLDEWLNERFFIKIVFAGKNSQKKYIFAANFIIE